MCERACVCVKEGERVTERQRERAKRERGEIRYCEECVTRSFVLPSFPDEEVERSYSSSSAVGVRTWQTPGQDSAFTKQVSKPN